MLGVLLSSCVVAPTWLLLAACDQPGANRVSGPPPTSTRIPTLSPVPTIQHVPTPTATTGLLTQTSTVPPNLTAPTRTPTRTPIASRTPSTTRAPRTALTRDDRDSREEPLGPPSDLSLPFRIEDLGGSNRFISPFGILRHSRDAGHGHGGIDIPLDKNADVYAVSDGTILSVEESGDGAGGFDVILLILGSGGEGWGFLYEHVS